MGGLKQKKMLNSNQVEVEVEVEHGNKSCECVKMTRLWNLKMISTIFKIFHDLGLHVIIVFVKRLISSHIVWPKRSISLLAY